MLSYRHGFHAGNFADVHKHVTLVTLLDHLLQKPAPCCFIDTHAGAGWYDLHSTFARKHREFASGYLRVAAHPGPPPMVRHYLETVTRAGAPDHEHPETLRYYPGSPRLAQALLRPGDRMVLSELHTSEVPLLRQLFDNDRRVTVHHRDGYEALPGLVPPRERRGLVLLDPSYELRDEFIRTTAALLTAWRKWSTGMYLVWYPIHRNQPVATFHRKLVQGGLRKALVSELHVDPGDKPNRLAGSGLLIVNPPWRLGEQLRSTVSWLAEAMATGEHAPPRVYWLIPE
jgi:23S rRNA (adenine2030-N6)-methyltransferase